MDFWSRLIGGSIPSSSRPFRGTSLDRLATFKKTCHTLHQIWRTSPTPSQEPASIVRTRDCLERLNSILSHESRLPAPHPCHSFAATSRIYVTVTQLALSSLDADLILAAAILFNTLIDAGLDGVVESRMFARALVDLVRRAGSAGDEGEARLVELLFGVANNIRLHPEILPAWFHPHKSESQGREPAENGKEFAGARRKADFPFFYLLVDYVNHEDRSGDFARTGLMYIIETASRSKDLEKWLIESDLATLIATGLGGRYSLLHRKLVFTTEETKVPHIIMLSDHAHVETARPPLFGSQMDSFLSYLLFWQDTIDHCKSVELNDTLLDHFHVLFLQQILYPSLLESSDMDGGSTSAVITYLFRMLESLDQPDLVHRILHFLLASPLEDLPPEKVRMSLSRRKSIDFLASFVEAAAKPSPSLFNLVDLVMMTIRSKNRQTVVATLRLVKVIMQRHHSFACSLIKTIQDGESGTRARTVGALNAELRQLFTMATSVIDDPSLDQSYDNYLSDASALLASRMLISPVAIARDDLSDSPPTISLLINPNDGILNGMLDLLKHFFTNSVITNLALTDAFTSLASSNLLSLDGWLLVKPGNYRYEHSISGEEQAVFNADLVDYSSLPENGGINRLRLAFEQPHWSFGDVPAVQATLHKLLEQIGLLREEISDFDVLVLARRDLLRSKDDLEHDGRPGSQRPSEVPSHSTFDRPIQYTAHAEPGSDSPRGRKRSSVGSTEASPSRNLGDSRSRSLWGSPLRDKSVRTSSSRTESLARGLGAADELRKRLATTFKIDSRQRLTISGKSSETASVGSFPTHPNCELDGSEGGAETETESESVTLGHILTNTVILYEFILELIALIQVRAGLFQEVRFIP